MTIYLPKALTHAATALLGACVALLVALYLCSLTPTTTTTAEALPASTTTTLPVYPCTTDGQCCAFWAADALGIHFTIEDGATEELDSFSSLSAWCADHKATALFN